MRNLLAPLNAIQRGVVRRRGIVVGAVLTFFALWLGWFALSLLRDQPLDPARLNARTEQLNETLLEETKATIEKRQQAADTVEAVGNDPFDAIP